MLTESLKTIKSEEMKSLGLQNFPVLFILLFFFPAAWAGTAAAQPGGDLLSVAGIVRDAQGKGISGVRVEVLVNGRTINAETPEAMVTDKKGTFLVKMPVPAGVLPGGRVELRALKPSWHTSVSLVPVVAKGAGQTGFQALGRLTLQRQMTPAFWLATLILAGVYLLISLEWLHRTLAALLGAALMLFISYTLGTFWDGYFIISFENAMAAIDQNVIFLLLGMMIIVGVTKKTGLFQWLAYQAYALARGNIFILAVILMWVTAVTSAFLDNVTTMLLLIPVTIEIAVTLKLNPLSLLIPEVFASNVGGTATLIGDPPNILIGSYANLTFGAFVHNLTMVCVGCMIVSAVYFVYWHKKDYLRADVKDVAATIRVLRQEYRITDRRLLSMCLALLGFTVFLFIVHGVLHMEPSVAALTGAMLLLTLSRVDIVEMLEQEVEWPTLIFFMALFMVIAGAEETGLIQIIAEWVREVSRGNLTLAILIVLWVSAIASAFIDNIPFTATMLPIIAFLNETIPGAESGVLWWALALGACLGGNGTMIGASANVVTVGLAERAGYPISFLAYMRACFVPMLITIVICSGYLLFFFR
jgi:Na+/H+ antiporter NhaD/arsenite permease-like protein